MYDQSFNKKNLAQVFHKFDFRGIKDPAELKNFREETLNKAVSCATTGFVAATNPLVCFPLNGRQIFMFSNLWEEMIVRKLCLNLNKITRTSSQKRSQIVSSLRLLLEEGIPLRVYRLDVSSFYESFNVTHVLSEIDKITGLSPQSKRILYTLFECHACLGGTGIPRGLALSATLSEHLMQDFDYKVTSHPETFFFSRYVDDIIVITSAREDKAEFIDHVKKFLPHGLNLNPAKRQVVEANKRVCPTKSTDPKNHLFQFDYLGYSFKVSEPKKVPNKKDSSHQREVIVDIAEKKISKFKKRISRSFFDFSKTGNWSLLRDRIKFLTNNFSIYNAKAGGKKIAGIFHSYPLASSEAEGLKTLDSFLKNAVLSKRGRIFSRTSPFLTGAQKRELLSNRFINGHKKASFVYFSGTRIKKIQECWKN